MIKNRKCEEVVTGNGKTYRFSGTIGNIEKLSFLSGDPSKIFVELSDGAMPPTHIKNIITCTMCEVDNTSISELDLSDTVADFINDFGLQDCAYLCRMLLNHALIGDVKKKRIEKQQKIQKAKKFLTFRLPQLKRPGLSWAAVLMIFVISACTIIKSS